MSTTWARRLITGAVMLVGVYDVIVGAILLGSSTPWWPTDRARAGSRSARR